MIFDEKNIRYWARKRNLHGHEIEMDKGFNIFSSFKNIQ